MAGVLVFFSIILYVIFFDLQDDTLIFSIIRIISVFSIILYFFMSIYMYTGILNFDTRNYRFNRRNNTHMRARRLFLLIYLYPFYFWNIWDGGSDVRLDFLSQIGANHFADRSFPTLVLETIVPQSHEASDAELNL